ncbi:putative tRNA (cytidine(32)/guanosine(34)-2'-O)-methyltransferase [Panonychus citri]|uniref:putative tRNA (cytidine(32)/guanosine(34)-2'-O)-methyltransferase n=1 Tax=Panonychus citri TaxID=50023 RepID=UPI00230720F2|nr:putative tRNA (cytidine(32)/guanosine(34)-2'-O)-methyltransferase [Panonychus citri]
MISLNEIFFQQVIVAKPRSSRNSSIEAFVVCTTFQPPEGYEPTMFNLLMDKQAKSYFDNITNPVNLTIVPFVACGDLSGFDADRSYPLDTPTGLSSGYKYNEPTQKPIDPPYQKACQLKRSDELAKQENE